MESEKVHVAAVVEETLLVKELRERKEKKAAEAVQQNPRVPQSAPVFDDSNPLLSPEEILEKSVQEKKTIFLTGIAVGAAAVGAFFLIRWIFTKKPETFLEEALKEAQY